jgi:hypothetical protein
MIGWAFRFRSSGAGAGAGMIPYPNLALNT